MAVNWLAVLVYILQVATFYCDQDCQVGICNGQIPEIWSFLKWFGMKKLFGMYVIVWHFLMVLALKMLFRIFLKPLVQ